MESTRTTTATLFKPHALQGPGFQLLQARPRTQQPEFVAIASAFAFTVLSLCFAALLLHKQQQLGASLAAHLPCKKHAVTIQNPYAASWVQQRAEQQKPVSSSRMIPESDPAAGGIANNSEPIRGRNQVEITHQYTHWLQDTSPSKQQTAADSSPTAARCCPAQAGRGCGGDLGPDHRRGQHQGAC
jgi:hypothetical protein